MVVAVLIGAVTVPLFRGRLTALGELSIRAVPAIAIGLALQILVISVIPDRGEILHRPLHVLSYLLAGWFFFANRRLPGLVLMGIGGLANFTAIAANGGVMPASPRALATAGRATQLDGFVNSAAAADARVAWLGDVFAIPAAWPFSNVFSIGDVALAVGAFLTLHTICRSRLPRSVAQFTPLGRHRGFPSMWAAHGLSNVGDWMYTLAVAATVVGRSGSGRVLATLVMVQVGSAAVTGFVGAGLVDRVPRARLMVVADLVRALAVGSLLLVGDPSLAHLHAVAACLGTFGALFTPAFFALLPNVVGRRDLVLANSLVSATFYAAVMVGPVAAGVLVGSAGAAPVFGLNAATFVFSAVLLMRIRGHPAVDRGRAAASTKRLQVAAGQLGRGLGYVVGNRLARGLLLTTSLTVAAASVKLPLEPVLVMETLSRGPSALGFVGSAWGLGMVVGAVAAPALARRWNRQRLLVLSIAAAGAATLLGSRAVALLPLLAVWVVGGGGNAVGSVAAETLLQEIVPDRFRGRVLAVLESAINVGVLVGAAIAAVVVGALGARGGIAAAGAGMLLVAGLATRLLRARGMHAPTPGDDPQRRSVRPPDLPPARVTVAG